MTLTDKLKILDDKVKVNQAQYNLDREAAKISLLSYIELDKYEYFTSEVLGYKPEVVQKVTFEYSQSGEGLNNKVKSKTYKRNKVVNTDKQDKKLICNLQHSFVKFKNIKDFKELSLGSMHKKLNNCRKKITGFKNVSPQTKNNEDLKAKVLENVGDLFNELNYL